MFNTFLVNSELNSKINHKTKSKQSFFYLLKSYLFIMIKLIAFSLSFFIAVTRVFQQQFTITALSFHGHNRLMLYIFSSLLFIRLYYCCYSVSATATGSSLLLLLLCLCCCYRSIFALSPLLWLMLHLYLLDFCCAVKEWVKNISAKY